MEIRAPGNEQMVDGIGQGGVAVERIHQESTPVALQRPDDPDGYGQADREIGHVTDDMYIFSLSERARRKLNVFKFDLTTWGTRGQGKFERVQKPTEPATVRKGRALTLRARFSSVAPSAIERGQTTKNDRLPHFRQSRGGREEHQRHL
jgi:hypothetical protein